MKKKLRNIALLSIVGSIISMTALASLTTSGGSAYKYCYCGPQGIRHTESVQRGYSNGQTWGSAGMEISRGSTSFSVRVNGQVKSASASYVGSYGTGRIYVRGNVPVTETHSYSPY